MSRKTITSNRRARRDYEVIETHEAGIVLRGSEVKSLRAGQANLKDAYGEIRDGELWLENAHIAPYQFAREGGHQPERSRKLLMHRREIDRMAGRVAEKGLTIVPLSLYWSDGRAKVELALAKGRRMYDKRQAIRKREEEREMQRAERRARR
jgi:SsrA-binding protein